MRNEGSKPHIRLPCLVDLHQEEEILQQLALKTNSSCVRKSRRAVEKHNAALKGFMCNSFTLSSRTESAGLKVLGSYIDLFQGKYQRDRNLLEYSTGLGGVLEGIFLFTLFLSSWSKFVGSISDTVHFNKFYPPQLKLIAMYSHPATLVGDFSCHQIPNQVNPALSTPSLICHRYACQEAPTTEHLESSIIQDQYPFKVTSALGGESMHTSTPATAMAGPNRQLSQGLAHMLEHPQQLYHKCDRKAHANHTDVTPGAPALVIMGLGHWATKTTFPIKLLFQDCELQLIYLTHRRNYHKVLCKIKRQQNMLQTK